MTRRSRKAWILATLLGGLGCATPQPLGSPVETGQLVLWEATAPAGGQLHLLGTLHVGRTHTDFDPAIRVALDASDVLALELRMTDLEPAAIGTAFAKVGVLSGETIFERVSPETGTLLHQWLEATGTSEAAVVSVKPWAVWLMVVSAGVASGGLGFDKAMEKELSERAAPTLPIIGLETLDAQFAALDGLPAAVQEEMLRASLEGALAPSTEAVPAADGARDVGGELSEVADLMIDAWQKGDLAWIESLTLGAAARDYSDALIVSRNETMADGIERLIAEGHRPFVAVGAAHMVGVHGLPTLLRERGYRVRRVPKTHAPAAEE